MKRRGIKLIGEVKKSGPLAMKKKLRLKFWREKLKNELGKMWLKNGEEGLRGRPKCCSRLRHERKIGWRDEEEDDDECDACSADREVRFMSF